MAEDKVINKYPADLFGGTEQAKVYGAYEKIVDSNLLSQNVLDTAPHFFGWFNSPTAQKIMPVADKIIVEVNGKIFGGKRKISLDTLHNLAIGVKQLHEIYNALTLLCNPPAEQTASTTDAIVPEDVLKFAESLLAEVESAEESTEESSDKPKKA